MELYLSRRMIPKIKKKLKSFLMDEAGTISKNNLIKGALILTGIGAGLKAAKASCTTAEGTAVACSATTAAMHGTQAIVGSQCEEGAYKAAAGETIGTCCNADGFALPGTTSNKGSHPATWWCSRSDCGWLCITEDNADDNSCPDVNQHNNAGQIYISGFEGRSHSNILDFIHDAPPTKGLTGKHSHHGAHGSWNEMENCPDTLTPHHANHCSHGSHGSHCSWMC
jgi:hypothetical protein